MGLLAASVRRQTAQMMFTLAAMILAFGPILDSAAKALPARAPPGSPIELLQAFDVIDDVLDHLLPGQPPPRAQHQLQLPHALPAPAELGVAVTTLTAAWPAQHELFPPSAQPASLKRPPRI